MYLLRTPQTFDDLIKRALEGSISLPDSEQFIPLRVCWVEPDQPTEVFDRVKERHIVNQNFFVMAEWAGQEPRYISDGRRYRKRFRHLAGFDEIAVTFEASNYYLRPLTAILASRRTADGDGPDAIEALLIVCDEDNRHGFPAYLAIELDRLEEAGARDPSDLVTCRR